MGPNLISTVTVPADSYDLANLDDVKTELGISGGASDAVLRRYISSASAAAIQYCNCAFVAETITDEFWAQRDRGLRFVHGGIPGLQLSRSPIISVTSVTENGSALVDATDFRIDYANGQLIRLDVNGYPRPWPVFPIVVVYVGGYATVPSDVSDAVIRMAVSRYMNKGIDPLVKSVTVPGVITEERWVPNTPTGNMTPDIEDVLDNYRVPVVSGA